MIRMLYSDFSCARALWRWDIQARVLHGCYDARNVSDHKFG